LVFGHFGCFSNEIAIAQAWVFNLFKNVPQTENCLAYFF